MKKLLLLAAGALLASSANATTWAVVGSYSDPSWNFEASTQFSGSGDVLTCQIPNLKSDFKIVDITNNNWDVQYGTTTPIELGKTYTLDGKNGGADPSNINFAGNILSVNNAVLTWNPSAATLSITGEAVTGLPTLYATGGFNSWTTPGENQDYKCTLNGSVYTVNIDLGNSGNVEFKLAGEGWSNEIAGGVEVGTTPVKVTKGGGNLSTKLTGVRQLTFNYDSMEMYFGPEQAPSTQTIDWFLVGTYCDWKVEQAEQFEGSEDILSCTLDYLTTGFKIVDKTNELWYGIEEANITLNKAYTISTTGNDMVFGGLIQGVKNVKVNLNTSTKEVELIASESDLVIGYPTLYVTGSFNEWVTPGEEGTVLGTGENGLYTFNIDFGTNEEVEFKLAGAGWSNEIAGGLEIGTEPVKVTFGGDNLVTTAQGLQTIVFNYDSMEMYIVPQLFIVGDDINGKSDWDFNQANALTYNLETKTYSWKGSRLSAGFKFNNGAWNNGWNIGAEKDGMTLEYNKAFDIVNDGNSVNIVIPENTYYEAPVLTLSLTDMTVTLVGGNAMSSAPYVPEVIYLKGSFDEWGEGFALKAGTNGVYSGVVTLEASEEDIEFKLDGGNDHWYGAVADEDEIILVDSVATELEFSSTGSNWIISDWTGGTINVTVNWNTRVLTLTATLDEVPGGDDQPGDDQPGEDEPGEDQPGDGPSSVNSLQVDNEDVIYTLQGVRVNNNQLTKGLYIINGKKVVVK